MRKGVCLFMSGILLLEVLSGAPKAFGVDLDFYFKNANIFNINDGIRNLSNLEIIDFAGGTFTPSGGIRLIIRPTNNVIFERTVTSLSASGTAVQKNRVSASPTVTYSKDLLQASINVEESFQAGEKLVLSGLKVRVSRRRSPSLPVGLDYTGDGKADIEDGNGIRIKDVTPEPHDRLAPYPVANLTASYQQESNEVRLAWENPPDIDVERIVVKRFIQDGESNTAIFEREWVLQNTTVTYTDATVIRETTYAYQVIAQDADNSSELAQVEITSSPPPPVIEEPQEEVPEEPEIPDDALPPEEEEGAPEALPPLLQIFDDVPKDEWFAPYADYLSRIKALESGGKAYPGALATRAEFALWLAAAAGFDLETPAADSRLSDVRRLPARQKNAINVLVAKGVIQGYPDGTFRPNQSVNRVEAAKILQRGLGLSLAPKPSPFTDVVDGEWYQRDVDGLYHHSVVDGLGGGKLFGVNETITKAAAWKMISLAVLASRLETIRPDTGKSYFDGWTGEAIRESLLKSSENAP